MQGQLFFCAVALALLGNIISSPIHPGSGDADPAPVYSHRELQVSRSNPVLGDIPIVPNYGVDIINRRCKYATIKQTIIVTINSLF